MPVFVHEITMVRGDLIRVEVRDPPITKGELVGPLETAETGNYSTLVSRTNPNTGNTEAAYVIGPEKKHLKFLSRTEHAYLDRSAADAAGSYGTVGGRTVTAVYRKSYAYDAGACKGTAGLYAVSTVSMRHLLYLQLDGALANGSHTIPFPAGTGLGSVAFEYDDKTTRASCIHANQVGYRRNDVSKLAYMSQWVPGAANEGATDLSQYSTFHVIDANGNIHFTGSIVLRRAATDAEPVYAGNPTSGTGYSAGLFRAISTNVAPLKIEAMTKANPCQITYSGTAFTPQNGDVYWLAGVRRSEGDKSHQLNGTFVTVSNLNTVAKTFDTERDASSSTFTKGYYYPEYDSLIHQTTLMNRAGTHVYGLDFSAWVPCEFGAYRLYVPGLGVSDSFEIDDAIWLKIAKVHAGGVYNHRLGMALDGRFGYTRTTSFRDGVNNFEIYKTVVPAFFTSEGGWATHKVASDVCDDAPYVTAERVAGWYGGHMDAGDWDTFIYAHFVACYNRLELLWHSAPESVRTTDFGIPKSSQTIGSLYSEIDRLGCGVHEALWMADAYRRLQNPDGSVGSGFGVVAIDPNTGPSWLYVGKGVIHAPDHVSNFAYALVAAKLACIFRDEGFTSLYQLWSDSAVAAWNWAEAVFQKLSASIFILTGSTGAFTQGETITGGTSGATGIVFRAASNNHLQVEIVSGAFQNGETITGGTSGRTATLSSALVNANFDKDYYYESVLGLRTKAGWSASQWRTCINDLQTNASGTTYLAGANGYVAGPRTAAAAMLFRLTGEVAYGNLADDLAGQSFQSWTGIAAWEYTKAAQANATVKTNYLSQLSAQNAFTMNYSNGSTTFRNNGYHGTSSVGVVSELRLNVWQFLLTGNTNILNMWQAGQSFILGANPYERCWTTGLGHRGFIEILHVDALRSAQLPPPGITIYGPDPGFFARALNFGEDSTLNYIVERLAGLGEADYKHKQVMEPNKSAVPKFEFIPENRYCIHNMEYTFHQTIDPNWIVCAYLHAHSGNRAAGLSSRKFGARF